MEVQRHLLKAGEIDKVRWEVAVEPAPTAQSLTSENAELYGLTKRLEIVGCTVQDFADAGAHQVLASSFDRRRVGTAAFPAALA